MFKLSDFNVTAKESHLSNGTRIILFERPDMPISLNISFLAGSRFDQSGKEGTAHFLEHILMSGTEKYESSEKLFGLIEEKGGFLQASTDTQRINLYLGVGDPEDVDTILELASQILVHSLFDPVRIETERKRIYREIEGEKANKSKIMNNLIRGLLYQETDVAKTVTGTPESIKDITRDDLIKHFREYIVADRAVIVCCGGIPIEKLTNLCEKSILIPNGSKFTPEKEIDRIRKSHIATKYIDSQNSISLSLDFRCVPVKHKDLRALTILASALGGGTTSILAKKLRHDLGLVYTVSADVYTFLDGGKFSIETVVSPRNIQQVLDIIARELILLKNNKLETQKLDFIKSKMIKGMRMTMQTSQAWANWHTGKALYIRDKLWTIEDYFREIEEVSLEDIQRVACDIFTYNNWYLSLVGKVDELTNPTISL